MIDSENSSILDDIVKRISEDICEKGVKSIIEKEVKHLKNTKPLLFVSKENSNVENKIKKYISFLQQLKDTDPFKKACNSDKKEEELLKIIKDAILSHSKGGKRSKRKTLKRRIRHRRTSRK